MRPGKKPVFLKIISLIYPGGIVLKREQNRKKPEERGLKKKNGFIVVFKAVKRQNTGIICAQTRIVL